MRSTGVHHIDLVVSDLARSLEFYRTLLSPAGWTEATEIVGERGEPVTYLWGPGSSIGLRVAPDGDASLPVDRYRVGLHHIALEVPTCADVDACAQRVIGLGGRITDGPRAFTEYPADYYGVFVRDPDDLKLEIVSQEPRSPRSEP